MGTGYGASVISWSQVELDGQWAAPLSCLQVGTAWSWVGEAIRLDGSPGPAPLDDAAGEADRRRRAARAVAAAPGAGGRAGAGAPEDESVADGGRGPHA